MPDTTPWDAALDDGLTVVSGKGGTGKSTLAAAVAVVAARRGRRVLVVEAEARGEIPRTLGIPDPGYEERPTPWGFSVLSIRPRDAVTEYLRLHLRIPRAVRHLIRPGVLEHLVEGVPGLRDLLVVGKLHEILDLRRLDRRLRSRPRYDLVLLDAPPTGQLGRFLAAAEGFAAMLRAGPVRRQALAAAEMLRHRSRVLLVTIPEEMAVVETLEAATDLPEVGVPLAGVVPNRRHAPPAEDAAALKALRVARIEEVLEEAGLPVDRAAASAVLRAAREEQRRARREENTLRALREIVTLPDLPLLPQGPPPEIALGLADAIEGRPRGPEAHPAVSQPAEGLRPEGLGDLLGEARTAIVCGAGGVGKTTVAAAIAVRRAEAGSRTVALTVDPARRLATALGIDPAAGQAHVEVGDGRSLEAVQLDVRRTLDEVIERLARSPEQRDRIFANPIYRRLADTLGGTHEYMAMEKLFRLARDEARWDALVIDTPPTRSALSFLDAPARVMRFLQSRAFRWLRRPAAGAGRLTLAAIKTETAALGWAAERLLGTEAIRDLADLIGSLEGSFGKLQARAVEISRFLRDPSCAFVVVATPAPASLDEAGRFLEQLTTQGMHPAGVVLNRWHPDPGVLPPGAGTAVRKLNGSDDAEHRAVGAALSAHARRRALHEGDARALVHFRERFPWTPVVPVPELPGDVHDVPGLERVARHLFGMA